MSGASSNVLPIIDSHIHLFAASHLSSLSWTGDLPSGHVLNRQNSVAEYRAATSALPPNVLRGFVFLETDRKSSVDEHDGHGWTHALDEVGFLARIAQSQPPAPGAEDEGYTPADSALVLAIVPWAPVPAGPHALAAYVEQALERTGPEAAKKIRGVRYLLQDKAAGVMLQPDFIAGLRWLAACGLAFDLGVDARSAGLHQLREACEMLERVYEGDGTGQLALTVVVNHLCKPNLRVSAPEAVGGHPDFVEWKTCVEAIAGHASTYMKLSGLFSELPPQNKGEPASVDELLIHLKPWLDVVFSAFGPARIMFGSDWPVCNMGGPGVAQSWQHYHRLVSAILAARSLSLAEQAMIWSGTAARAYKIDISH